MICKWLEVAVNDENYWYYWCLSIDSNLSYLDKCKKVSFFKPNLFFLLILMLAKYKCIDIKVALS